MKIGFIGAGKVGCSLGKYFKEHDIDVTGYFSKTKSSAQVATNLTGTIMYNDIETILKNNDTLFLTVPDNSIDKLWDYIRNLDIRNKNICHCSGSISSTAFFDAENKGASVYSIHPLCAISDKLIGYKSLKSAVFTIEGSEKNLMKMRSLFKSCGNDIFTIKTDKKALYHAGAVMCSNLVISLYSLGVKALAKSGLDQEVAKQMLMPLLKGNVKNIETLGIEKALTGPVERNDLITLKRHLQAFADNGLNDESLIYNILSKELINIAQIKNCKNDYSKMKEVLINSEKYSSNF